MVVAPLVSSEVVRIAEKMPEPLTKFQDDWLPGSTTDTGAPRFSLTLTQTKLLAKDNAGAVGLSAKLAGSRSLAARWLLSDR